MKYIRYAVLASSFFLPSIARAEAPCGCDKLPALEAELFQQEWLQKEYRTYDGEDPTASHVGDPDSINDTIQRKFNCVNAGAADLNACMAAARVANANATRTDANTTDDGGSYSPARTNVGTKSCEVEMRMIDNQGKGVGKDGKPDVTKDENKWRNRQNGPCKEVNDYLLAHEKQHQKVCRDQWKNGKQGDYKKGDFFSADDAKAYGAGIANLRRSIAKISRDCGWEGSNDRDIKKDTKKDGNKNPQDVNIVPTPARVKQLATALRGGK